MSKVYTAETAHCPNSQKFRILAPDLFDQNDLKTAQIRLGNREPDPNDPQNAHLGPFWKLVLVHLEDIKGEKGHFESPPGTFRRFN